mmetsp:Transcript_42946/g.50378  ORF Transcript_42946/g.50378 Transcript_42946/m.50378 type:complete len:124 (-) Transcript_42946:21-392(-)
MSIQGSFQERDPERERINAQYRGFKFDSQQLTADNCADKYKSANQTENAAKFGTCEKPKLNYLSMSAKERVELYDIAPVPKFGLENQTCKTQFSDAVELHPLEQIDDFDIDTQYKLGNKEETK